MDMPALSESAGSVFFTPAEDNNMSMPSSSGERAQVDKKMQMLLQEAMHHDISCVKHDRTISALAGQLLSLNIPQQVLLLLRQQLFQALPMKERMALMAKTNLSLPFLPENPWRFIPVVAVDSSDDDSHPDPDHSSNWEEAQDHFSEGDRKDKASE